MSRPTLPDIDNIDYFELFGIGREVGADEVRGAFHDFARRFHPDLYVNGPDEHRRAAARVYRRATEAYRVLLDPQQRATYIEQLGQGKLRLDPAAVKRSVPASAGTSSNPLAAKHINEARIAIQRGDFKTALKQLKSAKVFDSKNETIASMLQEVQEKLA